MSKNLIILCCFLILIFGVNRMNAQAFDGQVDYKIFLGYLNIDGRGGLELQYDYGWNDIISTGGKIEFLLDSSNEDEYNFEGFNKLDIGAFIRAHLSIPLNLPSTFDPYFGVDFSFKSIGAHAGAKYSFSEIFGIYAQVSPSFFNSVFTGDDDFKNPFAKKLGFSGGLTIYF